MTRITRPHRSRLKRLSTAIIAAAAGVTFAVSLSGTAAADPTPTEIEAQIDQQWQKLEPVIENFNKADTEFKDTQARVQKLEDQIRPLALQVDVALTRVSDISVSYYQSGRGTPFSALLSSGSPTSFADQLMMLNGIAAKERAQIKDVKELKDKYDAEKKPLDTLLAQVDKQRNDLATQKAGIQDQITKLNQMRTAAYGSGAGLGNLKLAACPSTYDGSLGSKAAQVACKQIGKPYIFNTDGPSTFDCSGLTMYAWAQVGVTYLRHYTQWQYEDTKRVSAADLQVGDLIFIYPDRHHMSMYVGNGYMVHAPHTGDVVRMALVSKQPVSGYGRPKY